ncbi:response regulator transcription factor [Kaistella carnis]|uniref:response regulator transcription factor n=1 Tax=Kaistella carnis TaxID=1241979 RepID=UPI0028AA2225|nr:response regulator transcription factor [Kaistella carnis]
MKKKIILYESQRLYLDCIQYFLQSNVISKNYQIVGITEFGDIEKNITTENSVLFLNVTGINTFDITDYIEKFLEINPTLKIIVNSLTPEARMIKKFFDKGVKSYLGGTTSKEEFLEALHQVMDGKVYVNDNAKNALLNFICSVDDLYEKKHNSVEDLTAREKDVLLLICDGLRSKEIAEKLFISTHTVESHRRNMMLKFNINNSSKLVKFALENRLVEY